MRYPFICNRCYRHNVRIGMGSIWAEIFRAFPHVMKTYFDVGFNVHAWSLASDISFGA